LDKIHAQEEARSVAVSGVKNRMKTMVWSRLAMTFAAGAASMTFMAGAAHAQVGQSDAPLEIVSDKSEYLQNEGRGVYTGNVVATQGDSKITTDKLTFVCSKTTPTGGGEAQCDEIEVLIAEGKVFYLAPDVRIRGDRAQYDFPTDTITITGDVILSRGEDGVVRGTNVVYSISEGRTVITAGRNRVTSVFNTAKKPATPAGTTPAPGAAPAPAPN
jgi:lipopolysaccharide export system protein LptA